VKGESGGKKRDWGASSIRKNTHGGLWAFHPTIIIKRGLASWEGPGKTVAGNLLLSNVRTLRGHRKSEEGRGVKGGGEVLKSGEGESACPVARHLRRAALGKRSARKRKLGYKITIEVGGCFD